MQNYHHKIIKKYVDIIYRHQNHRHHAEGRGLFAQDSSLTPMCRGDVGRCVYFVAAAARRQKSAEFLE